MFDTNGCLKPGIQPLTPSEFIARFVTAFPGSRRRGELARSLLKVAPLLRSLGVRRIVVAGSMVTDKPEPGDCDGFFDVSLDVWGRLQDALRIADPGVLWSWDLLDRQPDEDGHLRTPQWLRYGLDLYPQIFDAEPDFTITQDGYPRQFPEEFFQYSRDGIRQGIVELILDP